MIFCPSTDKHQFYLCHITESLNLLFECEGEGGEELEERTSGTMKFGNVYFANGTTELYLTKK